MCCGIDRPHGIQRFNNPNACMCGCNGPGQYEPRFLTKKQRIAGLEDHLEILREEKKAVEEHIAQIRKEK